MYVFLTKKIVVPNSGELQCVAWNSASGWLATGGEHESLRVLQTEMMTKKEKDKSDAAGRPSLNQLLTGHKGKVICIKWNSKSNRLTSSDSSGLIIVWVFYRGEWFEEMINNRMQSVVTDMEWSPDGKKICIVYEDGAIIVGSVEGNRIWGDDLKDTTLYKVAWSPDGRLLLFGTGPGDVLVYDCMGLYSMKVHINCLQNFQGVTKLAGIKWYDCCHGYYTPGCPTLAISYTCGRLQLMRNETDEEPVLVDTEMTIVDTQWNFNGSVLAIAGQQRTGERDVNIIQFYNPLGEHLRSVKMPGRSITGISFEGTGMRIAASVDTHIYSCSIRGLHTWAYCTDTVIYAYPTRDRTDHTVVFWNFREKESVVKHVRLLRGICAHKDFCVMSARNAEERDQFVIVLCNNIGTPLEHKYIDMEPLFMALTDYHVIVANHEAVYVWEFRQRRRPGEVETLPGVLDNESKSVERVVHVDDVPSGAGQTLLDFRKTKKPTRDPIASITASNGRMVLGRVSGVLQVYSLPRVSLFSRHLIQCRPHSMYLNSLDTRIAIVDISGIMQIFDFEQHNAEGELGQKLNFQRKDVWDVKWAEDNPRMFAIMEKGRMYIFRDLDPEEPISTQGYICEFKNLEVLHANIDELMLDPNHPTKDHIKEVEIKSLRDSRDLLNKVSVEEATQFIKDNPHPRLWQLLADSALEELDMDLAEQAFVHCRDYAGLQFVKKLRKLNDPKKVKAEVSAYFKNFEAAERSFLVEDRRDLAVQLRLKMGDWFRVLQLLKAGHGGGDDVLLNQAMNAIGDYYVDRQKWKQAISYYQQAGSWWQLSQCFLKMEDYESLQALIPQIPEDDTMFNELGRRFASVGMCRDAVACYLKAQNPKAAVDTCVELNKWHQAVTLAKQMNLPDVDMLLSRYAGHLLQQEKRHDAVQLYREAKRFPDAAALLFKMAKELVASEQVNKDFLRAKKLYIMGGMMMEEYRKSRPSATQKDSSFLDEESKTPEVVRMLDGAWRGAEAIHYYLAGQRALSEGEVHAALRMGLQCTNYEDILPERNIYSLLALAAALCRSTTWASQAIMILQESDSVHESFKGELQVLATRIFSTNQPTRDRHNVPKGPCPGCKIDIEMWVPQCPSCQHRRDISMTDGIPLNPSTTYTCCWQCQHHYEARGIKGNREACPLCYGTVKA